MRTLKILFLVILLTLSLVSCDTFLTQDDNARQEETSVSNSPQPPYTIKFDTDQFTFSGDPSALRQENYSLIILKGGIYELSGCLEQGNIVIDIGEENITIILSEDISFGASERPPIYIKSAATATLEIKGDNTEVALRNLTEKE